MDCLEQQRNRKTERKKSQEGLPSFGNVLSLQFKLLSSLSSARHRQCHSLVRTTQVELVFGRYSICGFIAVSKRCRLFTSTLSSNQLLFLRPDNILFHGYDCIKTIKLSKADGDTVRTLTAPNLDNQFNQFVVSFLVESWQITNMEDFFSSSYTDVEKR